MQGLSEKPAVFFVGLFEENANVAADALDGLRGAGDDGVVYADITDALLEFAGPCDPVVQNPNQIYYLASTHPDRIALAEAWQNMGEVLDWRRWPRNARSEAPNTSGAYEARTGSRFLDPEQVFQHKKGSIKAKDVTIRRIYLETMEDVLRDMNKVVIDSSANSSGVVPYLPLPELERRARERASEGVAEGAGEQQ